MPGPLVTAERPRAIPEKLVPNPIRAATATGTAHNAAPANPRDASRRRHQGSSPLPIGNVQFTEPLRGVFTQVARVQPTVSSELAIHLLSPRRAGFLELRGGKASPSEGSGAQREGMPHRTHRRVRRVSIRSIKTKSRSQFCEDVSMHGMRQRGHGRFGPEPAAMPHMQEPLLGGGRGGPGASGSAPRYEELTGGGRSSSRISLRRGRFRLPTPGLGGGRTALQLSPTGGVSFGSPG